MTRNTTTTRKARQGGRGRTILIIMLVSLGLALIAWVGVSLYGETTDPDQSSIATPENSVEATDVEVEEPSSPVNTGTAAPSESEPQQQ